MSGVVTIVVAPRRFLGSLWLRVAVDGAKVGDVRQGGCLEIILEPGPHRFRVTRQGFGISRSVNLAVAEGSRLYLDAGPRRPYFAVLAGLIAMLGARTVPHVEPFLMAPVLVGLMSVPGMALYLRTVAQG